uniref:Uncharacterized protein n=1 Tax=Globodera pallida TaxID=36090 RepID=A0A183BZ13_GLOPA
MNSILSYFPPLCPQGGDDNNGHLQLQLAIARRIHDRLWQALNATLATDLLPFGPSLLRRDSMERQHLAAMLEALRQLRLAHRQCLASINCCNVPGELFTARNSGLAITVDGGNTTPKTRDDSANACGGMPKRRKILVNAAGREDAQKEEHTVATVGDAGGCGTVSSNIVYGTTTAQQQPTQKQLMDDLPNLRRELQRPPANAAAAAAVGAAVAATASSCSGNANAVAVSPTADVSSTSSYSQASSLRELLARPPILHVVVPQQQRRLVDASNGDGADEQPLNLCVRDHDKRNGREI